MMCLLSLLIERLINFLCGDKLHVGIFTNVGRMWMIIYYLFNCPVTYFSK